jgi:hypothetical protein
VPPELLAQLEQPQDDRIEVWPDMVPAVSLFFSMETQWRWTGAGMAGAFRTGLDYSVLPVLAGALDVPLLPQTLADLRSLERGAIEEWSRKMKR